MIAVLIVTHGGLASELLSAAETIAGAQPCFRALSLDWSQGVEAARERIASELASLPDEDGVIILTDMFGDTPSNAALTFRKAGRVEVVSGVNLPMVVRLACTRAPGGDLERAARWLEIKGRRSIRRAGSVVPTTGD